MCVVWCYRSVVASPCWGGAVTVTPPEGGPHRCLFGPTKQRGRGVAPRRSAGMDAGMRCNDDLQPRPCIANTWRSSSMGRIHMGEYMSYIGS
jgi:hypothetical protein